MRPIVLPQGTRVLTPHGVGTVVYVWMASPDFAEPAAYSIYLDARATRPHYLGTIIPAKDVSPEEAS